MGSMSRVKSWMQICIQFDLLVLMIRSVLDKFELQSSKRYALLWCVIGMNVSILLHNAITGKLVCTSQSCLGKLICYYLVSICCFVNLDKSTYTAFSIVSSSSRASSIVQMPGITDKLHCCLPNTNFGGMFLN